MGPSPPRKDRCLVLRALLLDDELGRRVSRLFEALPVLAWLLLHVALQVIQLPHMSWRLVVMLEATVDGFICNCRHVTRRRQVLMDATEFLLIFLSL